MMEKSFIKVLLPLSLDWVPTYSTVENVERGQVVSVIFCKKKYLGIVWETGVTPDIRHSRILPINSVERNIPVVGAGEIALWEFISDYYLCSMGEVCKLSYPSFRARSERIAASRKEALQEKISILDARLQARLDSESKRLNKDVTLRLESQRDALIRSLEQLESYSAGPVARKIPSKPRLLLAYKRIPRYIEALKECMDSGHQALVLCPDLAFSYRMEQALRQEFPESLMIVNSTKAPTQRYRAAESLRSGEPVIILGTRNAIFLPFSDLALIIVDEEQDWGYKNNESSPRFNARDCAVFLGTIHSSQLILGTAAPSLESYYNCLNGKYELKRVEHDCGGSPEIIDMNVEFKKRAVSGAFSVKLLAAIRASHGAVVLLRGWESREETESFINSEFGDKDIHVMTFRELKQSDLRPELIAVLQADALLVKDDFRGDERALQIAAILCGLAPKVLIQTAVASRFDGSRGYDDLLVERKEFGFPPFTRLVEIHKANTEQAVERHFLKRDAALARNKAKLAAALRPKEYIDVDPA